MCYVHYPSKRCIKYQGVSSLRLCEYYTIRQDTVIIWGFLIKVTWKNSLVIITTNLPLSVFATN